MGFVGGWFFRSTGFRFVLCRAPSLSLITSSPNKTNPKLKKGDRRGSASGSAVSECPGILRPFTSKGSIGTPMGSLGWFQTHDIEVLHEMIRDI